MTHHKAKQGHLYVIATESGLVKFGISINPKSRLKQHKNTFGAVSPIVDSWVSPAFFQYKEAEQSLIAKYGSERVEGIPFLDVLCDAQIAYEDFSAIYEVALNDAYAGLNRDHQHKNSASAEMSRANFLLDNSDQDLTAYFLVPIVCELLNKPHTEMPIDVRDGIANKISSADTSKIANLLAKISIGGSHADVAIESLGLSHADFYYEVNA